MNNHNPPLLVTVCLPCYNAGKTIERTLNSVLAQDYPNFEVLICDNSSTDDTVKIVNAYADSRIRVIINPVVKTAEDNWNYALKFTKGHYIALYHADDVVEKTMVRTQVYFLETHPETSAVFTATQTIDVADRFIEIKSLIFNAPQEFADRTIFDRATFFNAILRYGNFIMPTVMTKKEVIDKVGNFEYDKFKSSSDLAMWMKLVSYSPVGYIHQKLHRYRVSTDQGGAVIRRTRLTISDYFLVIEYYLNKPDFSVDINDESFKYYQIHKLHDNVMLAMNMLNFDKTESAKLILERELNFRILLKGTRFPRKLFRTLVGYIFLLAIYLGVGKHVGQFFYRQYYKEMSLRTKQIGNG